MPKKSTILILAILLSVSVFSNEVYSEFKREVRVLVFYKTSGFYHKSIPAGIQAIQDLGAKNRFKVDTTANSSLFNFENLKQYEAIIFLNTTGDVLDKAQQKEFERYIQSGKGFVGIHAATDTEFSWPWYNKLVGAYFSNHPKVQPANILVSDKNHPSTSFLPDTWQRTDEWYNFKSINEEIKVLAYLDETSYTGGENGDKHPIAWYHEFDGGRAFYTGGGHSDESYNEPLFQKHILGGIKYAIGE
jgi:type 1 glutamine amidotransferase